MFNEARGEYLLDLVGQDWRSKEPHQIRTRRTKASSLTVGAKVLPLAWTIYDPRRIYDPSRSPVQGRSWGLMDTGFK